MSQRQFLQSRVTSLTQFQLPPRISPLSLALPHGGGGNRWQFYRWQLGLPVSSSGEYFVDGRGNVTGGLAFRQHDRRRVQAQNLRIAIALPVAASSQLGNASPSRRSRRVLSAGCRVHGKPPWSNRPSPRRRMEQAETFASMTRPRRSNRDLCFTGEFAKLLPRISACFYLVRGRRQSSRARRRITLGP